jgi:hypothetical protein
MSSLNSVSPVAFSRESGCGMDFPRSVAVVLSNGISTSLGSLDVDVLIESALFRGNCPKA